MKILKRIFLIYLILAAIEFFMAKSPPEFFSLVPSFIWVWKFKDGVSINKSRPQTGGLPGTQVTP
jgi:hypothetical protein